mmetsp:Transcript_52725/g.94629  ORF Transcript_52725/g.94629 Transcript_52725/m.94629 type:complete len:282 (+) Transcript_52725:42-887(+)
MRKPDGELYAQAAIICSNHKDIVRSLKVHASSCCDQAVQTTCPNATNDAVVAFFTPRRSPAVADLPVLLAALNAKADHRNSMIDFLWIAEKFEWVCNATHIPLHRSCIDADGKWPVFDKGRSNLIFISADLLEARNESNLCRWLCFTGSVSACVRICFLQLQAQVLLDHVLEGIGGKTTLAAMIIIMVTIHKLLLTERDKLAGGDEASTLDVCHRREGPATATGSLIFHRIHGALLYPVDAARQVCRVQHLHVFICQQILCEKSVPLRKLLRAEICKRREV